MKWLIKWLYDRLQEVHAEKQVEYDKMAQQFFHPRFREQTANQDVPVDSNSEHGVTGMLKAAQATGSMKRPMHLYNEQRKRKQG